MTPIDLFMYGVYAIFIWVAIGIGFVILGAWSQDWDRIGGAIDGGMVGLIIGVAGTVITTGVFWIAAVILWIITL